MIFNLYVAIMARFQENDPNTVLPTKALTHDVCDDSSRDVLGEEGEGCSENG